MINTINYQENKKERQKSSYTQEELLSKDNFYKELKKDKNQNKEYQKQKSINLFDKLNNMEVLDKTITLTDEEKLEFEQFKNLSSEEFETTEKGWPQYIKEGNNEKIYKCILYYISHQRNDDNNNRPYNDLLYRHAAQYIAFSWENIKAAQLLQYSEKLNIYGERKAIDNNYYRATLAFFNQDIQKIEEYKNKRVQENSSPQERDNTLEKINWMLELWKQRNRNYKEAYRWK